MRLRILDDKDVLPVVLPSHTAIPVGFGEIATDTVDFAETGGVVDGDFAGSYAHVGSVGLVEVVDVVHALAGADGEFEAQVGEVGVPWSWEFAERGGEAAEDLGGEQT